MLPDLDWKKKSLEVKHIWLQEAMDKVCLWESAREQASQMAYHNQDVEASTNAVKEKQVETCFNSGKEGHFVRDSKCPPRGRKPVWNVIGTVIWLAAAEGKRVDRSLEEMRADKRQTSNT